MNTLLFDYSIYNSCYFSYFTLDSTPTWHVHFFHSSSFKKNLYLFLTFLPLLYIYISVLFICTSCSYLTFIFNFLLNVTSWCYFFHLHFLYSTFETILKRYFSNHRYTDKKKYIYKIYKSFQIYHNTTIILLQYQNNLSTITIIKCEWLRVSLESIKTVGVKNREDRENKGMSRRTIRPEQLPPHPFRGEQLASNAGWNLVHRIPAHVDRLVELQPRLNLTRWQKILSHNCTRPSDGIDRAIE